MNAADVAGADIPIFHMASFSRSGETLVLRCLNAHPQIEVVHQIRENDTAEDIALFEFLKGHAGQSMPADHPMLAHRGLEAGQVLLVKNATWCHPFPRRGFILVRNPFSVVKSAGRDTADKAQREAQRLQQRRWARGIDPLLLPMMYREVPLVGFLALYSRKVLRDRSEGLPFFRYEDFVPSPEPILRRIVSHLGLEWSPRVMLSHRDYPEGEIGHGGIRLLEPIMTTSLTKYQELSGGFKSMVYGIAHEALQRYGYVWDGSDVALTDVDGML